MPSQASIRCWPRRWDSPITTYVICMPSFVRVMFEFEYASTNKSQKMKFCELSRLAILFQLVGRVTALPPLEVSCSTPSLALVSLLSLSLATNQATTMATATTRLANRTSLYSLG